MQIELFFLFGQNLYYRSIIMRLTWPVKSLALLLISSNVEILELF